MTPTRAAVAPVALSLVLVAGCGNGASTDTAAPPTTAVTQNRTGQDQGGTTPGTTPGATAASSDPAADCPTEATRSFAKTRFVADVALAAGTFHRYIWNPYRQGSFTRGADGRIGAIAKAAGTAALDLKLLSNAKENVKADPTLCRSLYGPLSQATEKLDGLKDDLLRGDLTSLASVNALFATILGRAQQQGLKIDETTDPSSLSQGPSPSLPQG